jgi:hypothetical protein
MKPPPSSLPRSPCRLDSMASHEVDKGLPLRSSWISLEVSHQPAQSHSEGGCSRGWRRLLRGVRRRTLMDASLESCNTAESKECRRRAEAGDDQHRETEYEGPVRSCKLNGGEWHVADKTNSAPPVTMASLGVQGA